MLQNAPGSTIYPQGGYAGIPPLSFTAGGGGDPLRQSLFWNNNGQPAATWCWLSRQNAGAYNQRMVSKQIAYKSNTMTFVCYAPDAKDQNDNPMPVNPYQNNASPAEILKGAPIDESELTRWHQLLQLGLQPGINLIPCFFFGDHLDVVQNAQFMAYIIPALCLFFRPYSRAMLLACEANRGMTKPWMECWITQMKHYLFFNPCPVGVHMCTTAASLVPSNADFQSWEGPYNPMTAYQHSVDEGVSAYRGAIAGCKVPSVVFEDDAQPESIRAHEVARQLAGMAGCWGLPGPV